MGRFFSNIQIKNNLDNREQFIEELNNVMKKRELIPATEDDASLTYIIAFSKNNQWITLCSADYESGGEDVKKDVQFLAESLKKCCISTSVVDSDFTILEMYNGTSTLTDMVVVGDGEDYGFEDDTAFQGKKEHWQPLLGENVTWEQLSEIWNGDYIFTEDALSEMAPLIGMDSENIISDYEHLSSQTNENIVELHYKKIKEKTLSLNTAFKQVFGEALEPLGFVKIKSKYPYLVRVVEGGEIIHVITYRNEGVDSFGFRVFNILGGIATVSRQNIDLTLPPIRNLNWFSDNSGLYLRSNPSDFDPEFRKQIDHFAYVVESKKMMIESLNDSLETTKKIMLPIFDQVTDLNACIDFFNKFHPGMLSINVKTEFGDKYIGSTYNEGFLYIKLGREKYIEKKEQHRLQCFAVEAKNRSYSPNTIKQLQETFWGTQEDRFAAYNKIFDDTDWIAKALAELERRKVANTETLRSYGLNL